MSNKAIPEVMTHTGSAQDLLIELCIHACENDWVEVIRWITDRGLEPDLIKDGDGIPALHIAIRESSLETVRLLVDRGADRTYRDPAHDRDADDWAHHVMHKRPDDQTAQAIHDLMH